MDDNYLTKLGELLQERSRLLKLKEDGSLEQLEQDIVGLEEVSQQIEQMLKGGKSHTKSVFETPESYNLLLPSTTTTTATTTSSQSSSKSATKYESVILGNRQLKQLWKDVSLESISAQINNASKEQFRALALEHAPFIIEMRNTILGKNSMSKERAKEIVFMCKYMFKPYGLKPNREGQKFKVRVAWLEFLGAAYGPFFNPTLPNQSGYDTKNIKSHFSAVMRQWLFGSLLNIPYQIDGDKCGLVDLPLPKRIKKDISLKFKYRHQTEHRLIDRYEPEHREILAHEREQDAGNTPEQQRPNVVESPRRVCRKGSVGLGRPRLTAEEKKRESMTSILIDPGQGMKIVISPIKRTNRIDTERNTSNNLSSSSSSSPSQGKKTVNKRLFERQEGTQSADESDIDGEQLYIRRKRHRKGPNDKVLEQDLNSSSSDSGSDSDSSDDDSCSSTSESDEETAMEMISLGKTKKRGKRTRKNSVAYPGYRPVPVVSK